jgi:phosphoribosylanthranilate isomerase
LTGSGEFSFSNSFAQAVFYVIKGTKGKGALVMIVQIYEIQTPEEAEECIDSGVDHIGSVILDNRDWKQPVTRDAIRVSEGTSAKNSIIPLFDNMDAIFRCLDYYRPHFIHFCETLTDEDGDEVALEKYITIQRETKKRFPEIKIIRSIPIPLNGAGKEFPTLSIANQLEQVSDFFLTDTWLGKEPVKGFIGITGKQCDHNIARNLVIQSKIPVILAGGLSPENVYDAIVETAPAGADSCTLTNKRDEEGNPIRFKKDFSKVKKFVEETRRAEELLGDEKERLKIETERLKERLRDREAALPAHSIRPNQLQVIEELEDEIYEKEKKLMKILTP